MARCVRLFVSVVFLAVAVVGQYEEGDTCEISNDEGVCKFLTECPTALADLRKGIYPIICGYVGTQSLVCCASQPVVTPKPPPPTPKPPTPTPKPVTYTQGPVVTIVTQRVNIPSGPGAKAKQKCLEYAQYAYQVSQSSALAIFTTTSKVLSCAISTQPLIVGGVKAARKEFPHMVQIGYNTGTETTWDCAGSLISELFVLTAGHCINSIAKGEAKLARAGLTSQSDTYYLQIRNVVQRIKHPDYNFEKYNDIALLKVDQPFKFNPSLRPACLFTERTITLRKAIASGWGLTEFAGEGSEDLMKVTLEFFTTAQCNNTYRRKINEGGELGKGIIEETMICAGSSDDRKDTCQGDSGGPLQTIHPKSKETECMYDIVGVTSFGAACGVAKNSPGVYTRVSQFVKWIEDTVWPY